MKSKGFQVLFLSVAICCFMYVGGLFCQRFYPKSPFALQYEYAQQLENKLINLLEPATGVGNIRASVRAEITNKNIVQKQYNPFTLTETIERQRGPVLEKQFISVLINERDKGKMSAYQNLIKGAAGYDPKRGDFLSIEMLPFPKVPLWTFGLTPICLMRLAGILTLFIVLGIFWLVKERKKTGKTMKFVVSNNPLWEKAEKIPSPYLAEELKRKNPEVTATILHSISIEKASELMEFFDNYYKNQISLHLNYIEKLGVQRYLLQKAEKTIYQILKSQRKTPFHQFLNWKDEDIQNILRYVHRKDFVKAIQVLDPCVQTVFKRNIPPALWQEIMTEARLTPATKEESLKSQEKILKLAHLLKKGQ